VPQRFAPSVHGGSMCENPQMNRFDDLLLEIAQWRRDLHAHPEIGFALHRTAPWVAALLRRAGCDEVVEGIGQCGVVGVIHGRHAGNRTLGFRADMDALPIEEGTGLPHASTHPGAMHACGHDGHTAILLGSAFELARTRNFSGSVVLLFQPAEEGGGGARAMVADGVMERWGIDEVYGLHNLPGLPIGSFAIRSGTLLAATDFFDVQIRGQGAHGAMPHTGVDPTLAAAAVVMALQSIVARNVPAREAAVLSVTGVATASMAHNVIPDSARLTGTVRTLNPSVRTLIHERMARLVVDTAAAYGCQGSLMLENVANPTINAPEQTAVAVAAARAVGDVDADCEPSMGGEDFADMLAVRPGAYIFLGNGDSAALHNPHFEFNDAALASGCGWFVALAEQRLAR
jgi:amidohydrolase